MPPVLLIFVIVTPCKERAPVEIIAAVLELDTKLPPPERVSVPVRVKVWAAVRVTVPVFVFVTLYRLKAVVAELNVCVPVRAKVLVPGVKVNPFVFVGFPVPDMVMV